MARLKNILLILMSSTLLIVTYVNVIPLLNTNKWKSHYEEVIVTSNVNYDIHHKRYTKENMMNKKETVLPKPKKVSKIELISEIDHAKKNVSKIELITGIDYAKVNRKPNFNFLDKTRHYTNLKSYFDCSKDHITLLVLVKSHPKDYERRKLVRDTWGKLPSKTGNDDFRKYFLVGATSNNEHTQIVKDEGNNYTDIVYGEFEDVFYNLPKKAEMGFEWSYKHCSFDYLLETDDDVFINIPVILQKIKDHCFPKTNAYLGREKTNDPVVREERFGWKYLASLEDYTGTIYPPYCSGGAYIFSQDVIKKILPFIKQNPYKLDDVYIGMLVYNAAVKVTHFEGFNLVPKNCSFTSNMIAHHVADKDNCMTKLFHIMIAENLNNDFLKRNYL